MEYVLRGAMVDQAQSHRRGDPARAEGVQLAGYGVESRHPQRRADQPEDDRMVAGRPPIVDALGLVADSRGPDDSSGGGQQRAAGARRRVSCF